LIPIADVKDDTMSPRPTLVVADRRMKSDGRNLSVRALLESPLEEEAEEDPPDGLRMRHPTLSAMKSSIASTPPHANP
jgi:hypothetical protein